MFKPNRSWRPVRFKGDCFTAFAMTGDRRPVRFAQRQNLSLTSVINKTTLVAGIHPSPLPLITLFSVD